MPDGNQSTALTAGQKFNQQLDAQVDNFRALLPSHIPVERFKRTVIVAVSQNPDLFNADRRSLFNAAQKCATDGLLPDGRQAALVVFNTKVKERLPDGTFQENWKALAQYMPMVQGIRQRMRNSGEVTSAEAHVVYRNDKFIQSFGDDGKIIHEPPALGQDRGEPVGAYAIIKLKSGEVIREVMDKNEIERVRAVSRSKDGPAWRGWWGEMARKTVLRRCAKAAPNSAEIDGVLARDDELPQAGSPMIDVSETVEPEPQRQISNTLAERSYAVVDLDGEEHEFATAAGTVRALAAIFADARKRKGAHPALAHENNAATIEQLRREAPDEAAELDPFGLPPAAPGSVAAPSQQASADDRQERPGADDADTPGAGDAHTEPTLALDDGRDPLHVPLPRDPKPEQIAIYVDRMREALGESPSFARRAKVKLGNEDSLRRLKALDLGAYQDLMRALDGRDGP